MAELPSLVRVKRKRSDEPTPDLFLEQRDQKKAQIWQFRLQASVTATATAAAPTQINDVAATTSGTQLGQPQQQQLPVRREFRLARPAQKRRHVDTDVGVERQRKRKHVQPEPEDIPTFIEATSKRRRDAQGKAVPVAVEVSAPTTSALKRPGANAKEKQWRAENWKQDTPALAAQAVNPPPDRLADALHRFALEEEAREEAREKPKVTTIPKKPVQRFRDRNPEEFAARTAKTQHNISSDGDVDMSDEDDYVYDTYIRTRHPVVPAALDSTDPANENIGYIVISEEDQPLWETYFEDEETDKEFETDDEDENAEGYYAADYPEDEVASDDEFDQGAYGYRNGASDDEQWDSDPEDWSGDEDAMQNPWKKYPWMRAPQGAARALRSDDEAGDED